MLRVVLVAALLVAGLISFEVAPTVDCGGNRYPALGWTWPSDRSFSAHLHSSSRPESARPTGFLRTSPSQRCSSLRAPVSSSSRSTRSGRAELGTNACSVRLERMMLAGLRDAVSRRFSRTWRSCSTRAGVGRERGLDVAGRAEDRPALHRFSFVVVGVSPSSSASASMR